MKDLIKKISFPIVMSFGLCSMYYVIKYNTFPVKYFYIVLILFVLIILGFLEKWLPFRKDWSNSHNDEKLDAFYLFFAQFLLPKLAQPVYQLVIIGFIGIVSKKYSFHVWPDNWNLFVQLALALVIAEFGRYWIHRAAHEINFLWRFHAIHHSPNRLYFLNAARFHPIEKLLFLIPETIPFIILGTNQETLLLYAVFNSIHGLFQHCNVDIKLGFLNYLFSMTELHRWHHSKKIIESNKNYGNNLIIWDIIFGTFYLPPDRLVNEIGLLNHKYPQNFIGQFKAPFMGNIDKPEDFYSNPKKYEQ